MLIKSTSFLALFTSPILLVSYFFGMSTDAAFALDVSRIVQRVATDTTVRILTPGPSGSAVVVKNNQGCIIATALHVVDSVKQGESGEAVFASSKSIVFSARDVMRIPGKDLAIIQLVEICPVQQIAVLGLINDVVIGDQVFVSGFSSNSSPEVISPSFRVEPGVLKSLTPQSDGYSLTYSADTQSGMSGGGVFDAKGRLIGIHGRGETLGQSGQKVAAMGILAQGLMTYLYPGGGSSGYKKFEYNFNKNNSLGCPGVIC